MYRCKRFGNLLRLPEAFRGLLPGKNLRPRLRISTGNIDGIKGVNIGFKTREFRAESDKLGKKMACGMRLMGDAAVDEKRGLKGFFNGLMRMKTNWAEVRSFFKKKFRDGQIFFRPGVPIVGML